MRHPRRFVAATTKALAELMAKNLSDPDVAGLMIDRLDVAGSCAVVARAITGDGTKVPGGLSLGDTENRDGRDSPVARPRRAGARRQRRWSPSSTWPRRWPRRQECVGRRLGAPLRSHKRQNT